MKLKNKNKPAPAAIAVYYIQTKVILGTLYESGFFPETPTEEFQVTTVLSVDAAKEAKRWKEHMAGHGKAFYEKLKK